MGTEGNGSTPDGFTLGFAVQSPRVRDSMLAGSEQGMEFITQCIARCESGDLGDNPTATRLINHLRTVEAEVAGNPKPLALGIYKIPMAMAWASREDYLVVTVSTINILESDPVMNVAVAAVLFLDEVVPGGWDG